jgi:hypothetical protein
MKTSALISGSQPQVINSSGQDGWSRRSMASDCRSPITDHRIPANQPQLELAFSGHACRSMTTRQRRLGRANWWFQRMRQIVDCACDWQPVPLPRPEQIWFPEARRQLLGGNGSQLKEAVAD